MTVFLSYASRKLNKTKFGFRHTANTLRCVIQAHPFYRRACCPWAWIHRLHWTFICIPNWDQIFSHPILCWGYTFSITMRWDNSLFTNFFFEVLRIHNAFGWQKTDFPRNHIPPKPMVTAHTEILWRLIRSRNLFWWQNKHTGTASSVDPSPCLPVSYNRLGSSFRTRYQRRLQKTVSFEVKIPARTQLSANYRTAYTLWNWLPQVFLLYTYRCIFARTIVTIKKKSTYSICFSTFVDKAHNLFFKQLTVQNDEEVVFVLLKRILDLERNTNCLLYNLFPTYLQGQRYTQWRRTRRSKL